MSSRLEEGAAAGLVAAAEPEPSQLGGGAGATSERARQLASAVALARSDLKHAILQHGSYALPLRPPQAAPPFRTQHTNFSAAPPARTPARDARPPSYEDETLETATRAWRKSRAAAGGEEDTAALNSIIARLTQQHQDLAEAPGRRTLVEAAVASMEERFSSRPQRREKPREAPQPRTAPVYAPADTAKSSAAAAAAAARRAAVAEAARTARQLPSREQAGGWCSTPSQPLQLPELRARGLLQWADTKGGRGLPQPVGPTPPWQLWSSYGVRPKPKPARKRAPAPPAPAPLSETAALHSEWKEDEARVRGLTERSQAFVRELRQEDAPGSGAAEHSWDDEGGPVPPPRPSFPAVASPGGAASALQLLAQLREAEAEAAKLRQRWALGGEEEAPRPQTQQRQRPQTAAAASPIRQSIERLRAATEGY